MSAGVRLKISRLHLLVEVEEQQVTSAGCPLVLGTETLS